MDLLGRKLNRDMNLCKMSCRETKKLFQENILTLQTTFSFTRVLSQDEFVDVFDILIHIIARFVVTVLLINTTGEQNNQIVQTGNVKTQ